MADTGAPIPTTDSAWHTYYISLERSLVNQIRQQWNISDHLAEMLVDKALDQPIIREMLAGKAPWKRLNRALLIKRLVQEYERYRTTHLQENAIMDSDPKNVKDIAEDPAKDILFKQSLKEGILLLTQEEQRIFVMRYVLDRSFTDIALAHGVSDETIRRKYNKAIEKLGNHLYPNDSPS